MVSKLSAVCKLPGGLLNLLVGQLKAGERMAHAQVEMVAGREVAREREREVAGGSAVGKVLRHDWIEIVRGTVAGAR